MLNAGTSNMSQIMQCASLYDNSHSSVSLPTTRDLTLDRLPNSLFAKLKASHHAKADEAMRPYALSAAERATMHTLVNVCDKTGKTRASQEKIADKSYQSPRTVRRHFSKFTKLGLISKRKNGWKESNTTILLFLDYKSINKEDNMSHNLTPSEPAPKAKAHEGCEERENKSADALTDVRAAQENQIWDDEIKLTDEEKAIASAKIKALKDLLRLNS